MEDKYVYYDRGGSMDWREIDKKYMQTEKEFKSYFGYIDDQFDENDEIIVYKLVPFKVFKKEINYKFIE